MTRATPRSRSILSGAKRSRRRRVRIMRAVAQPNRRRLSSLGAGHLNVAQQRSARHLDQVAGNQRRHLVGSIVAPHGAARQPPQPSFDFLGPVSLYTLNQSLSASSRTERRCGGSGASSSCSIARSNVRGWSAVCREKDHSASLADDPILA